MNDSNSYSSLWQRILLCILLVLAIQNVRADFSGNYGPSRWTPNFHGGDDGFADWESAPNALSLLSGTTGSGALAIADMSIRVTESGSLSFDWYFYGAEGASYSFAWLSNGVARVLASDSDDELTGSTAFTVQANDVIGFRVTGPNDPNSEQSLLEITAFVGPGQTTQPPTPPTIAEQPASVEACQGYSAVFSVEANNASSYQWQFNGQNIEDGTDSFLEIDEVAPADVGNYRVVVSNSYGSITSTEVSLTLGTPLTILTPPSSQTACGGQNITLCVVATSPRSLTYQWYLDDEEIPGATEACLSLSNIQRSDAGRYSVDVVDDCSSFTSDDAIITVNTWPEIEGQPRSQRRIAGETATFTVVHSGTSPFTYQWHRNGQPLIGADQSSLVIPNVEESDEGDYSVMVSDGCGTQTSQAAILIVEGESPRLSISRQTNNSVDISLIGPVGREYVLEVSTNLLSETTDWMPVTTNSYCNDQLVWRQTITGHGTFYRVRILSELPKVPVSPGGLSATSSQAGNAINLTWQDRSIDESEFIIERAQDGSEFSIIATVGAGIVAHIDSSVVPDDCYYYRVRSRNCAGESLPSTEASACTPAAIAAPSLLILSETSLGNVRVQWADNSTNETGFEIERSTDGVFFILIQTAPSNSDSSARIVDRNVVAGQSYSYRARAVAGAVKSSAYLR